MDVLIAAGSYRQSQIGGKFNMRAHSAKPSYVRKDNMRGPWQGSGWTTLLVFAIVYFVWGTTFLAIRVGVRESGW
jgi:hypothetical protein